MPSITIRERDLTSAGNLEATTNTVYIPGYANMGPTNEPILCETLQDFQLIFGSEPYKFRTAQSWPLAGSEESGVKLENNDNYLGFNDAAYVSTMGKFYEKGELEKSYIMAAEILKLGIPVLYERIFNDTADNINKWTANTINSSKNILNTEGGDIVIVSAKSPGLVSADIYFTLSENPVKIDKTTPSYYYTIKVGREKNVELSTSEISPQATKFTFDSQVAALYSDCVMIYPAQKIEDNSGLVILEFSSSISSETRLEIKPKENNKEYIYTLALPSTTDTSDDEFNVKGMYAELAETGTTEDGKQLGFNKLLDKGEYVIKFITSGAYPVFEFNNNSIAQAMVEVAANRGDCTALIDHTPNNERTLLALNSSSVYYSVVNDFANTYVVNSLGEDAFTYGAMFTPYGVYNCTTVSKQVMLPASHGYLSALAASVQTNGNWMAAAGVQRGAVPNLVALSQNLTNAIADSYEPRDGIAINPITNIKPYGLTIWGNRTLKNNAKAGDLTATSFLSIRQLTNDVKRTVWVAAKTLTFEQNSDLLWINFKSKIIPTLDQMVSGNGLSGYEIKKQKTTKKATVKAVIRLYAIEPVEDWDITIELADSSTEIAG